MNIDLWEAFKLTEEAWTEQEPNIQINEATAVATYLVEVDSGHDRTHIPNCTLDSAIKNTRSELVAGRHGYRYITWTDEATGNVVFEYYSKTHLIETDIPAAKAEIQGVVDAISGTLYAAISNVVYDTFTEAERQYLNTDLKALKYKIKEIQLRRELDKFPL